VLDFGLARVYAKRDMMRMAATNEWRVLAVLYCLLLPALLSADGGFFEYDVELARWRQVAEKQQTCFINYHDGYENMLLAVKLDSFHSTKAVWIFPVPASPDNVAIDVVPELPEFDGSNVRDLARQSIARMFSVMAMSQIYPLAFMRELPSISIYDEGYRGAGGGGVVYAGAAPGIEVHEHIEKLGLITELITARDRDAPYAYLKEKGLDLPDDARAILGEYVGADYSFVISWISDTARFQRDTDDEWTDERAIKQVALSIAFSADSIYFPLRLTSIYGSERVPIVINVLGYVTPDFYGSLKAYAKTNCCVEDDYSVHPDLRAFLNDRDYLSHLRYTAIEISAPAKFLTQDLFIRDVPPRGVWFSDWLRRSALLVGLLVFAVASLLASALSTLAVFLRDPSSRRTFTWIGLWNFLTLIGVVVAVIRIPNRSPDAGGASQSASAAQRPSSVRRLLYVVLFSAFFFAIIWQLAAILRALT
jgi:hypothetical protein